MTNDTAQERLQPGAGVAAGGTGSATSDPATSRKRRPRGASSGLRTVAVEAAPALAVFVLAIAAWEYASRNELVARIILPAPSTIWEALYSLLGNEFFYENFRTTMTEMVIGLGLGVGGGLVLGILTALLPLARRIIMPYAVVVESMPKIVLAPLTLVWFGYGISSKVALIILIVFFPVYLNTMTGLANSSEEERWLLKAMRANRRQTFVRLLLPNALPNIFVGLKQALVGAFIGAIVSEFVGARAGLGVLVKTYNEQLRVDYVYAVVIVMAVLSLIFFLALELIDRKVVFWRGR
jgi:NitT/TauT family transport system permease protein